MAAKPAQELGEHRLREGLRCCPILVKAMLDKEVTHSRWCDQGSCQVGQQELACVGICPQQRLTSCGRAKQVSADFQRESESINDAAVSASAGDIFNHEGDWLFGQIVDGSDDPQAVAKGGGTGVSKPVLIACRAEGLAIRTGHDEVDTGQ
jgi:hypothetical protein